MNLQLPKQMQMAGAAAVQETAPIGEYDAQFSQSDPLALALSAFVTATFRVVSPDMLLAGLPIKDGKLTPVLMRRALENQGYKAKLEKRKLSQITQLNMPAIIFYGDNDAVVLLKRKGKAIRGIDPQTGAEFEMAEKELAANYNGNCLLARRNAGYDVDTGLAVDRPKSHWFWGTIARLWHTYSYVILAAILINFIGIAAPLFTMNVYDRVLPNKALPTLWVLATGMVVALAFDYMLKALRSRLIEAAGRRADVLLSSRIYSHVLGIRLDQRPPTTGSFASHLKEFESVREFFTSSTIASFVDMAFFGLFLVVIYVIGGIMALVPAVTAAILIIAGLLYQIPLRKAAAKNSVETAQRHSLLIETLASLETVKLMRAEGHLQSVWEGLTSLTAKTVEHVRHINSSLANFTSFIQQLVSVMMVVVGSYVFSEGLISMGAIIASVMLAGKAVAPLGNFTMVLARSQQSLTSLKQLNKIMSMESEQYGARTFVSNPIEDATIQFKDVTFAYPGSPNPILQNFNLVIRPGEKVGIVGKIGSGKTTIGRLLTKLYEPKEGAVLIGGVDTRQYHPHEVRRVVGVLSQDVELFHGTLRSNILMAAPRATDAQLFAACKLAGADEFIRRHPSGFDLPVGERGHALSGGQRQTVALARLFISEPKVLFLDEPSSAMDLQSEKQLIDQLRRALKPEQTVIVSTHRYSMLDLVDRLIVLNNGKVAADGPKNAVLEALRNSGQQQAQQQAAAAAVPTPPGKQQ